MSMRVITGFARGRKLLTVEGLDVRPTTDMVKEAVFSIIQFDVEGSFFLDLFSGSGQMGIEALSRGAKFAVFVDSNKRAQETIRQNLIHTSLATNSRVVAVDSVSFIQSTKDVFDIAYLDPPYNKGILTEILPFVAKKMSETGIILCEHQSHENPPQEVLDFSISKQYKYGKIHITVYRRGVGAQ
ncbi:MAG: methyltransferase [Oscillospiraceae bacterium]|jgi:16S rRNA (guanine(966)-N(2))-methyltransferase RsmD|nr:methyltransferase [Oscillospiraceae bacterium]